MIPNCQFPGTHWTRVEQEGCTPAGREWFCETYRPAVLSYLRSKCGPDEAEDLCQEFFAKIILDRGLMGKADRARGSLRGLLRKAIDRFLLSHQRRLLTEKRGGLVVHQSLDDTFSASASAALEDRSAVPPDRAFDRAWAAGLMVRALVATEIDCRKRHKEKLFAALRPILDGSGPSLPHAEIAGKLGVTSRDVTTALSRLRQRLAKHLYEEVAATVAGTDSVKEEWETVRQALQDP